MENIPLPTNYQLTKTSKPERALITIEPCFPGYGVTLGNALRRVLLSSLKGAAAIAVKIKNVQHEFMTVPHVKEDVLEIILNLKNMRFKLFTDEEVKLELHAKGEKEATAKDIAKNSNVEMVNSDYPIATLTDKAAELEMEITVGNGRGYIPVETREKEAREVNTIPVDAIYSPVYSVGTKVESVRVGQMTNYERLILDVETDGTISPEEAFKQANTVLIEHFTFLGDASEGKIEMKEEKDEESPEEMKNKEEDDQEKKDEPLAEKEEKEKPVDEEITGAKEPEEKKEKKKRGRPKKEK